MTQETLNPIVFAPAGFRWAGEIAEGLPIVSEPDGSICEPLLRFFGWSFRMRRIKVSSMRDEAYTLREWWSHLRACGVSWEQATDQTMIVWREALKRPSNGGKAASPERINRKLAIVFEF